MNTARQEKQKQCILSHMFSISVTCFDFLLFFHFGHCNNDNNNNNNNNNGSSRAGTPSAWPSASRAASWCGAATTR